MQFPWKIVKASGAAISEPVDLTKKPIEPLVLSPASIIGGQQTDFDRLRQTGNRYGLADNLYSTDERLYSTIELMAIMIQKSIGDNLGNTFGIRADDETLSNEEENAVEELNKWGRNMKLRRLFYQDTVDLWKYGDLVDLIRIDGQRGVYELTPLPMSLVTAVDNRNQINKALSFNETVIMKPKWYLVDEQENRQDFPDAIYKKERILHISFNPRGNWIRDNLRRMTFGVWSTSPINSLIGILQWKKQLIRNDMLWRNRNVPRELHRLDLTQFDPKNFTGTYEEKIASAKTAAENALNDYNSNNQNREADQGIVTGMGVDISYLEPKTANYASPMPIIDQINQTIGGPTGIPSALAGGGGKDGFTALVQQSSFLALRSEIYAGVIQDKYEELGKRHLRIVRPGIRNEVVERCFIKNRLILDRDRAELAKIIAVLVNAKVFTQDEIRGIWGIDPLTLKQAQSIIDWAAATNPVGEGRTPEEVESDLNNRKTTDRNPTQGQESPRTRERNNLQGGQGNIRK